MVVNSSGASGPAAARAETLKDMKVSLKGDCAITASAADIP